MQHDFPDTFYPPTVIAVSPLEDWLFAYFPALHSGSIGCLWTRGQQIDSWTMHHYVQYETDAGVVTAAWTFPERPVSTGKVLCRCR